MRHYPEDDYDKEETARLNAEQWQLDLLKLNPSYVHWGPHEDYMWVKGEGWHTPILRENWAAFDITLNELNEVVNFYFSVERASKDCETCGGGGYHPDAQWVTDSFYSHSSPFKFKTLGEQQLHAILENFGANFRSLHGQREDNFPPEETLAKYGPEFRAFCEEMRQVKFWHDKATQDEVGALAEHGRLRDFGPHPTAEQVNAAEQGHGVGHDAINRGILCETRCKRFGVPYYCPDCKGHGDTFTEPAAHVSLTLWLLHPRKGASRGVEIERIERSELEQVFAFLRQARDRNAERFARIP